MLEFVRQLTRADTARAVERVQPLWSGCGEIVRIELEGPDAVASRVIVKRIAPPRAPARHPRGWNTSRSHERKLRSYRVEARFYSDFAGRCPVAARVAHSYGAVERADGERVIVLEDLDASGFGERRHGLTTAELGVYLRWLARFHSTFALVAPTGLWPVGTYWHLATRPDELAALDDESLRVAAPKIDAVLNGARYQTLVHGDAKVANFCFSSGARPGVAAVDFQYAGGGCGIKDVAYFLGSCMSSDECDRHAAGALDQYFAELREALGDARPDVDAAELEAEWRDLYELAEADFVRFLRGWAPGGDHKKLHDYADRVTDRVLRRLL